MKGARTAFDQDDDALLVKYIAVHNPAKSSRSGNALYRLLVQNAGNKWPWSQRHSWQSWRAHYRSNEHKFDYEIKKYQKKHGITVDDDPKQYTTRPHAWKTAWITTQGSSVVKNMDIDDDSDAGTDSENAITIVRSAESNENARKSAARKTVNASQRTKLDAGSLGNENARNSVEILSGPSKRSAKEREGVDVVKPTQKRRSADEYEGNDVGSKRRKVEEEHLRTKSSGQATEDVQEAKASGMRKGKIEEEESAADVEMRDDQETAKGTKASKFPTNHQ
ncbi:hypothetical protein DFH11DRAFT_256690 [Phellopilus nigrolimitatus]|nr:hypothetical protein DFH11DRAFT_256690 [Phellopilus nigrolimitatus]